jgi:hypothetical protein
MGLLGSAGASAWTLYDLVNAQTRVAVDGTTGNVGIGTASPISPLQVKGNATNTDGILTLTPNSGGRNHQVQSLQASSLFRIYDQSAGASRLEIDISGNVKVATTAAVFDASGTQQGLKLPATPGNADTQTLDCYQENAVTTTGVTFTNITTSAGTINCQVNWTRVGRGMFLHLKLYPDAGQTLTVSASWQINLSAVAGFPTTMTQDAPMPLAAGNTATIAQATAFINAGSRIVYGSSALTAAANVYYVLTAFIPY